MADTERELSIPRDLLEKYFKDDPRLISALENQSIAVSETVEITGGQVSATEKLQNATVVTLSTNESLSNEFVLTPGDGTRLSVTAGSLKIDADDSVVRCDGGTVRLIPPGPAVTLFLPPEGRLVSDTIAATLYNKTIIKPLMPDLIQAATNAEAAAAGVPLYGVFRDGNNLQVRMV